MDLKKQTHKSFLFTGDKKTCTGCGTCTLICAKSALSMEADEEGFLFPVMDSDKCVGCGLCDKRCPEVADYSNPSGNQHCYIATTRYKDFYNDSASIGICTMLSKYVIEQGGVVYGCYLDETNWEAYHIEVSNIDDLQKIRNSKYLQSDTKHTYAEAKKYLISGKMVLYIGTPCQIVGLKSYLFKEYDNLYTIDLICHGVFSPKLMPLEVDYWEQKYHSKIHNFRFRSKRVYRRANGGMVNFDILKNGEMKHIERFAGSSPTYHCFAYSDDGMSYNLRLSCYSCSYKSKNRYGDITVGDPWSIKESLINDSKLKSTNSVRSLYATNTAKGRNILSHISNYLYQEEYPFDSVFVQPAVIYTERMIPSKRSIIYTNLCNAQYGEFVERIFGCRLDEEHKKFVRKYHIETIKLFVKKLIGYYKWKK